MIIAHNAQLQVYRQATQISTQILALLRDTLAIGVKPTQINKLAGELCAHHQVKPAFYGVPSKRGDFLYNCCVSVNDAVLHGVPDDVPLKKGDLVKVDFGIIFKGYYTDHCFSVAIGEASPQDKKLLKAGRLAVRKAVEQAVAGNTTGDLGYVMSKVTRQAGFGILKNYTGHGIGHALHQDPEIATYGHKHQGEKLIEGMVLCIEAQLVAGSDQTYTDKDNWTIRTKDGENGVMFEYMVVVGKDKPEILTDTLSWPLVVG